MLFKQIILNNLTVWLIYGVRASGTLRTDRYNFISNSTWDNSKADTIAKNLEHITGLQVATYSFNAPKSNKAPRNRIRYVLNSDNIYIPLRFKPAITVNTNILKE